MAANGDIPQSAALNQRDRRNLLRILLSRPLADINHIRPPNTYASTAGPNRLRQALAVLYQHDQTNIDTGTLHDLPHTLQLQLADLLSMTDHASMELLSEATAMALDSITDESDIENHRPQWLRGLRIGLFLADMPAAVSQELASALVRFRLGFGTQRSARIESYTGTYVPVDYNDMDSIRYDNQHSGWLTDGAIVAALTAGITYEHHTSPGTVAYSDIVPFVVGVGQFDVFLASTDHLISYLGIPQNHKGDIYIPIHDHDARHWYLLVLQPQEDQFFVFDSHSSTRRMADATRYADLVRVAMGARRQWALIPITSSPQNDSHSCGIFVIENGLALMRSGVAWRPDVDNDIVSRRLRWLDTILAVIGLSQQSPGLGWDDDHTSIVPASPWYST